jgi:transposase-like protein
MDVKRAADMYAQGRTLRQIAGKLGVTETTVSDRLRRAGVTMRRSGPAAHSGLSKGYTGSSAASIDGSDATKA